MGFILNLFNNYSSFIIPGVFIAIIGIAVITAYYFSPKNTIIRAFKKNRKRAINSISENEYVKVIGKAKPIKTPLVAPLSGRLCVYYQVVVEAKGNKHWRRIINDIKTQDFFIETNTEMAIIKAAAIEQNTCTCYFVKDFKKNSGFKTQVPDKLEAYLKTHQKKTRSVFGVNKTIRYTEAIIALNEKIGVKGIAKWKSLKQPIVGYTYSKILTFEGSKKQKLLITDEPKALIRVQNKW